MKRRTCLHALCTGAAASALGACATQRRSARGPGVSDPSELTATEVVRAIRDGAIGAEAYASTLLTRCEAARPLNAISWIDSTRVLASARAVDLARARGDTLGPLAGLP